jgi:hypothetical protein
MKMLALLLAAQVSTATVSRDEFDAVAQAAVRAQTIARTYKEKLATCQETIKIKEQSDELIRSAGEVTKAGEELNQAVEKSSQGSELVWVAVAGVAGVVLGVVVGMVIGSRGGGSGVTIVGGEP